MKIGRNGVLELQVGDRVRVAKKPVHNAELGWAAEMDRLCDKEVTIQEAWWNGKEFYYRVKENHWNYCNQFFQLGTVFALARDTGGALKTEGLSEYLNTFSITR